MLIIDNIMKSIGSRIRSIDSLSCRRSSYSCLRMIATMKSFIHWDWMMVYVQTTQPSLDGAYQTLIQEHSSNMIGSKVVCNKDHVFCL